VPPLVAGGPACSMLVMIRCEFARGRSGPRLDEV